MKIRDAEGNWHDSPKETEEKQKKEKAKQTKEKQKGKKVTVDDLLARIEAIEDVLGIT